VPFAKQLRADVAVLASEPELAAWQKTHAGSRVELAHYQTEKDPYETDFRRANRWCAASVNRRPAGVVRTALFDVPPVSPGALPPLPEKEDPSLTQTCRLQALWYETRATATNAGDAALIDAIVRELSASWGKPNGSSATPDIQGGGLWKEVAAWHRAGINIWVAYDPKGWAAPAPGDAPGRIIAFARKDSPPDSAVGIWLLDCRFGLAAGRSDDAPFVLHGRHRDQAGDRQNARAGGCHRGPGPPMAQQGEKPPTRTSSGCLPGCRCLLGLCGRPYSTPDSG